MNRSISNTFYKTNNLQLVTFLLLLLLIPCHLGYGQQSGYFVGLKDKNGTPFSIHQPQEFLSARAIERRQRQNIAIDQTDLPINPHYISQIKATGAIIKHCSRWLNGVIIFCDNEDVVTQLEALSFVSFVEKTKDATKNQKSVVEKSPTQPVNNELKGTYLENQISMLNGHKLHQQGHTGEGMHIAVIDAGFYNVNQIAAFDHLFSSGRVLETRDFVADGTSFYKTDPHGMKVLSVMAGIIEGQFQGTAPDASYRLYRTEEMNGEYPIEADYWAYAAEVADSAGVDIIQSSLGYFEFDNPAMSYTHAQINGTTRISQAAALAAEKGIIVVNSAGNEGSKPWKHTIMPAEVPSIVAVGSISADQAQSYFSSVGYPLWPHIKPDVMAQGTSTRILSNLGTPSVGNGTSYSTPIISGLTACLWQSMPEKTSKEMIMLLRQSGSHHANPDLNFGYGIPNFEKAQQMATSADGVKSQEFTLLPNPFTTTLSIRHEQLRGSVKIKVFNTAGLLVWQATTEAQHEIVVSPDSNLSPGIYIIRIETDTFVLSSKLIKR